MAYLTMRRRLRTGLSGLGLGPAEDEYNACRRRYPVPSLPRGDALTPNDPCFNQLMASRTEEAARQEALRKARSMPPPAPAPRLAPAAPGKSQYEIYAEEAEAEEAAKRAEAYSRMFRPDLQAKKRPESVYDQVARLREEQRLNAIRSDMNIERPDKIMPIQVPGGLTDRQQSDALMTLAYQTKQERDAASAARGLKTAAGVGAVALVGLGALYLIFRNKK